MNTHEYSKRSFLKAVTYRIVIIVSDFVLVVLVTGRYDVAFGLVTASTIVNSALYYFHERFWNKVKWGRETL